MVLIQGQNEFHTQIKAENRAGLGAPVKLLPLPYPRESFTHTQNQYCHELYITE